MINKIDNPLAKLNDAVAATKNFLDAVTQKQAAELISLQGSIKQQAELVKLLTDTSEKANLASNPKSLADMAWPPLPTSGGAPPIPGLPISMVP